MEFNLFNYPVWTLFNITFPESKNSIAALEEIGILGFIYPNPFLLTIVKALKFCRVAVPIITVKLNNDIMVRQKSVNGKFISYELLGFIGYANSIKYLMTHPFQAVRRQYLLFEIHIPKHLCSFRVFIPAMNRAIGRIIIFLAGWRPLELFTTNFTGVLDFIPALPSYLVVKAAKEVFTLLDSGYRQIKHATTIFAICFSTLLSFWSGGVFIATSLAIFTIFRNVGGNGFAAAVTYKGTKLVLIFPHTDIIAQ